MRENISRIFLFSASSKAALLSHSTRNNIIKPHTQCS
ncbi:unnamed protein product [Spirodela intermedia]|uniref:Uncharacterized protein n=2 Tax=Spirodela intermedia TaxID=51605 RepID=A0A7I8INF9_SPIIN|nr:unnamed protein product [Spirodela intermedia]CAA6658993.1 unnamed protein product [Spirodela intermedia]CAA7395279.1 unnamed protein product [Spirodela intermedia]